MVLFCKCCIHIDQARDGAQTRGHQSSKEATLRVFGDSTCTITNRVISLSCWLYMKSDSILKLPSLDKRILEVEAQPSTTHMPDTCPTCCMPPVATFSGLLLPTEPALFETVLSEFGVKPVQ